MLVEMLAEAVRRDAVKLVQKSVDVSNRLLSVLRSRRHDLHAVTGRNDQTFTDRRMIHERTQRSRETGFGERQLFAHFDGRGFVADSDENDVVHGRKYDAVRVVDCGSLIVSS